MTIELDHRRRLSVTVPDLAAVLAKVEETQPSKLRVPSALMAAAEAVRMVAKKLCEETEANVEAARGMMEMLENEQQVFACEVTAAADSFAARVADFMQRGTACHDAIREHREAILAVARTAAESPPVITDPGKLDEAG